VTAERLVLHDHTADRLLAGAMGADEAPSGYEGVAEAVRAATGPATAEELSREQPAVEAILVAVRPAPEPAPPRPVVARPALADTAPVRPLGPAPRPAPPSPWRWQRTTARVAAVALLLVGLGSALALHGGGGHAPTNRLIPAGARTASVPGDGPVTAPSTSTPTTSAASPPAAVTTPRLAPETGSAPVSPLPSTVPPTTTPPTTVTPAPTVMDRCSAVDRLPPDMRAGLDQMARGLGFPSFVDLCRAARAYDSGQGGQRDDSVRSSGGTSRGIAFRR
jgi:hypothetical protein